MTIHEITALSNDDLNLKIMRICGWSLEQWNSPQNDCAYWAQFEDGHYRTDEKADGFPNYPADLNLMADAVEQAVRKAGTIFRIKFDSVLAQVIGHHDHIEDDMIHASALDRARAFVLTVEQHHATITAELLASIPRDDYTPGSRCPP